MEVLKNNFAILLARRLWTINVVHKKTGISRTTLTNLYYQRAKGIQFETLFKICNFLGCTPNEFLVTEEKEGVEITK